MASGSLDPAQFARMVEKAIVAEFTHALRAKILEALQPSIDAAVKAAANELQVTAMLEHSHALRETLVKVIVEDRRKTDPTQPTRMWVDRDGRSL